MWTRRELKEKGKASLRVNYWKTVLVALLVLVLSGGLNAAATATSRSNEDTGSMSMSVNDDTLLVTTEDGTLVVTPDEMQQSGEGVQTIDMNGLNITLGTDGSVEIEETDEVSQGLSRIALFALGALVIVVAAVSVCITAFLINPARVGFSRFFLCNLNQPAKVREVAYAFDHNYRETVRTMFWRDLYTVLWGLLLIIPGIVKAYEYSMIPYLLAEDPTMTRDRAFAESRRMMTGNKWKTFVLDLSFLGWMILSALTLGIVAIFYAKPYQCMTKAALYEALRYGPSATDLDGHALGAPSATADASQVPVPPFAAVDAPQPTWDVEPADAE